MNNEADPIKEETNPIEEGLSDLAVADEQADEAKGGVAKSSPKLFLACATGSY